MLFKELKQGYPIYILDCNKIEVGTGTVTYVGTPHITQDKTKIAKGQLQSVIDVTANFGGKTQSIELTDSLSQTMSNDGSMLITPNKEDVVNGVRMLQARSEEALRLMPMHEDIKKKCAALLQNIDPVYQQNVAYEKRLNEMQTIIDKQAADTKEMKAMIEKLLKKQ